MLPPFIRAVDFIDGMKKIYASKDVFDYSVEMAIDTNAYINTMSKGMRQKIALLQLLSSGRNLLVIDEPMSGLDNESQDCLIKMLDKQRKAGKTIIVSTHYLEKFTPIADHIFTFDNHEITAD